MKLAMIMPSVILAFMVFSTPRAGAAQDPPGLRAVEIRMVGNGPPVDRTAYEELMTYFASLVADGILDRYIVHGRGIEGGQMFCIQVSSFRGGELDATVTLLEQIKPDRVTTTYTKQLAAECRVQR